MTNSEPDYMSIANFLDDNWDAFVSFYGDDETGAQEQVDALRELARGTSSCQVPPSALQWTKERPKDADYNIWLWREYPGNMPQPFTIFWAAVIINGKPEKVLVAQADIEGDVVHRVANMSGWWAGPIPNPIEADEEVAQ